MREDGDLGEGHGDLWRLMNGTEKPREELDPGKGERRLTESSYLDSSDPE